MKEKRSVGKTFQEEKVKTTNKILVLCLLTKSLECLSSGWWWWCGGGGMAGKTADRPLRSVAPCCARQRDTLDPPLHKLFTTR